jgi:hypothetical protein
MGRIIAEAILRIPAADIVESREQGFPTVLIIGPDPFLSRVEEHLRTRFSHVYRRPKSEDTLEPLDAYRLLARDEDDNLAWRILMQLFCPPGWEEVIRSTHENGSGLRGSLPTAFVDHHLRLARILRAMGSDEEPSAEDRATLASALGVTEGDLESLLHPPAEPEETEEGDAEPTIWLTSLLGSKGLQAGHVFIVGVNDGHFPRSNQNPSDEEVCQLLVAVTRGRKSCTLVSTKRLGAAELRRSIFVDWLRPHLAPSRYIDRAAFDALAAGSSS